MQTMEDRIYHNPPIDEVYLSAHFNVNPPIAKLDFQQFYRKIKNNFDTKEYFYPIIERIGDYDKIPTEPEKILFFKNNKSELLQFGRDRLVYNWRNQAPIGSSKNLIYPKYKYIKLEFLKYWTALSDYIKQYEERKFKMNFCELYYSNILRIGNDHFLKSDSDLHKAIKFISPFPATYNKANSTIHLEMETAISTIKSALCLSLAKVKQVKSQEEAFSLILSIKSGILESNTSKNIYEDWYDKAHDKILDFFKQITTQEVQNFWKEK